MNRTTVIGVLALQGAFDAHVGRLHQLSVRTQLVKCSDDLEGIDGLIIPGGESTTMSNLLVSSGLGQVLREHCHEGLAVFGTCAGMIMMAREIVDGRPDQISLDAMDIQVRRNGYGRQVDSFEQDIDIESLEGKFHALFIRAPVIDRCGPGVEILAEIRDRPILVRQGRALASSFHPELVSDLRVHQLFLNIVQESNSTIKR